MKLFRTLTILIGFFCSSNTTFAEEGTMMHSGALAHALDRLAVTARVLYVAAHPDDENTRLLTHLVNARHITAAYLSMTRGGGGQNLIGREQDVLLDVIRTEELLAARRLDGALQKFTRMRDFGYSKTAAETFEIWDHEEALRDVVWVVRTFRPDVIITRFNENPPNHGHHTASAILAREAFAAAADPARFPEQLQRGAPVWQTDRLLHNIPVWRDAPAPPKEAMQLDVGTYDPRLGVSHGELAAQSRSQHKSQGFGVPGERGTLTEYFVVVAGNKQTTGPLEGVELGWTRFGAPGAAFARALDGARKAFDPDQPEQILPALEKAHVALDALPDDVRVRDARLALERVILAASGFFVRATAARPYAVPGSKVDVELEWVARRTSPLRLKRFELPDAQPVDVGEAPKLNDRKKLVRELVIPADAPLSHPHWLAEPPLDGRHVVNRVELTADAESPPAVSIGAHFQLGKRAFSTQLPLIHSWTDRVHGERLRRFSIVPPATVTPVRDAFLFPNGRKTKVELRVRAGQENFKGRVVLDLQRPWHAIPEAHEVELAHAGDETVISFEVTGAKRGPPYDVTPSVVVGERSWSMREDVIDHPHLPLQLVLQKSRLRLVPLDLKIPKGLVGYVEGSGDTMAEDLRHAGSTIETLDDARLLAGDLDRYAAIIIGIRAYNTRAVLRSAHSRLMAYVERGGTVLVNYNTISRFAGLEIPIGPFPLELGRGRTTDQRAEMTPLVPDHDVLTSPNRLAPDDYSGWVQERGLYYASKFDPKYQPIFRMRDPGEEPDLGSVLVARHGRGRYVYSGLSLFRQLPAGVPGAYRLINNLIARSSSK